MIIDILKKFISNESLISIEKKESEEKLWNTFSYLLYTIDWRLGTDYGYNKKDDETNKKNFLYLLRDDPDDIIESRIRKLEKIKKEISKDLENVSDSVADNINYCCEQIDIVIEMFNIYKNKFVKE